jgi:hypothetical protein
MLIVPHVIQNRSQELDLSFKVRDITETKEAQLYRQWEKFNSLAHALQRGHKHI